MAASHLCFGRGRTNGIDTLLFGLFGLFLIKIAFFLHRINCGILTGIISEDFSLILNNFRQCFLLMTCSTLTLIIQVWHHDQH